MLICIFKNRICCWLPIPPLPCAGHPLALTHHGGLRHVRAGRSTQELQNSFTYKQMPFHTAGRSFSKSPQIFNQTRKGVEQAER